MDFVTETLLHVFGNGYMLCCIQIYLLVLSTLNFLFQILKCFAFSLTCRYGISSNQSPTMIDVTDLPDSQVGEEIVV